MQVPSAAATEQQQPQVEVGRQSRRHGGSGGGGQQHRRKKRPIPGRADRTSNWTVAGPPPPTPGGQGGAAASADPVSPPAGGREMKTGAGGGGCDPRPPPASVSPVPLRARLTTSSGGVVVSHLSREQQLGGSEREPQEAAPKPRVETRQPRRSNSAFAAFFNWGDGGKSEAEVGGQTGINQSPGKDNKTPGPAASACGGAARPASATEFVDSWVTVRPADRSPYSPHLVALLYSCPVFTLCNFVTMISASCKSQTEVFARSLQSKLHLLNVPTSPSAEAREHHQHGLHHVSHEGSWRRDVGESFPFPGTTFPPRRCAQFDQLRAKYHSEPDLTPAAAEGCAYRSSDEDDDGELGGDLKEMILSAEDDGNDSDLFFDFDIGSPEEEALAREGGSGGSPNNNNEQAPASIVAVSPRHRSNSDESLNDYASSSGFCTDKNSTAFGSTSSGLCSDLEGLHMGSCGARSESSALENVLGDEEEPVPGLNGMSLEPQDWLLKRGAFQLDLRPTSPGSNTSSSTPIATQSPNTAGGPATSSPLISPDSLLDESENASDLIDPVLASEASELVSAAAEEDPSSSPPLKHQQDSPKTVEPMGATSQEKGAKEGQSERDSEAFSVYTGDHKHKIAHSKLNALIALLEKDREYARTSPTKDDDLPAAEEEPASPKSPPGARQGRASPKNAPSSPTKRSYKCSLPTIAASPANFSFLSAPPKAQSADTPSSQQDGPSASAKTPCGSYGGIESTKFLHIKRCESTPTLTYSERELIQSPQPGRRNKKADDASEGAPKEATESMEMPEKPDKLRRASSLKSGKTPPGTPGRRKIVRFADVFGLDLADVKTFLDEVPRIPKSAYQDLTGVELSDLESDAGSDSPFPSYSSSRTSSAFSMAGAAARVAGGRPESASVCTSLVPMFNQPGGFANFFDRLRDKKVCLENAYMADPRSVRGTIRVQNVGFHKRVTLLYTTNEWMGKTELEAQYMQGSCDGFSDKFTFHLAAAPLAVGQRLQFCLRYDVNGEQLWDNNDGKNYVFQCLSVASGRETSPGAAAAAPAAAKHATSNSMPVPRPHSRHHYGGSSFSHSPSAISEDPWLRYL